MSNIVRERYNFRSLIKKRNESVTAWTFRLRMQAALCKFPDQDAQIFDHIIANTEHSIVRVHAFKKELTLKQLIGLIKDVEDGKCFKCGLTNDHDHRNCPARSQRCGNCGYLGHVDKVCFKAPRKRSASLDGRTLEGVKKVRFNEIVLKLATEKRNREEIKKNMEDEKKITIKRYENSEGRTNEGVKKVRFDGENSKLQLAAEKTKIDELKNQMEKDERKIAIKSEEASKALPTKSVNPIPQTTKKEISILNFSIGGVPAKVQISDEYGFNVMSKRFFDETPIKCIIYKNKETIINGRKFAKALEAKVCKDQITDVVDFHFSDEIKESKCVITPYVAKKFITKA